MFLSRPVRPEGPSPPDSVSRGGSAGVSTPQGGSFLGHDSRETPWSAVSVLEQSVDRNTSHLLSFSDLLFSSFSSHLLFFILTSSHL